MVRGLREIAQLPESLDSKSSKRPHRDRLEGNGEQFPPQSVKQYRMSGQRPRLKRVNISYFAS